jgi:hypothetical protein
MEQARWAGFGVDHPCGPKVILHGDDAVFFRDGFSDEGWREVHPEDVPDLVRLITVHLTVSRVMET